MYEGAIIVDVYLFRLNAFDYVYDYLSVNLCIFINFSKLSIGEQHYIDLKNACDIKSLIGQTISKGKRFSPSWLLHHQ